MNGPDIRVCFLGDSFTLGTGDPEGLGWVGRVLAAERARGVDLTAYNLGVRGQTGAEIAERAVPEVSARLAERGERRGVVFAFGTNDLSRGRPQRETLAAADGLLRWAAGEGYEAFVMSPPPRLEPDLAAARAALAEEMGRVARDHAAPFLDIAAAVADWSAWARESAAGDGVHPGAQGYRRMAQAFCAWAPWRDWVGAS